MEEYKEFGFFRGKVRFKQPKKHRLSIIELLFISNIKGIKKKSKVIDLGAGFGALSILIAIKYGCPVWAVEKDPLMLELLEYNVIKNGLEEKIQIINSDIKKLMELVKPHSFDCVVANPPFFRQAGSNPYHHETETTLEDFIKTASKLLRDGGVLNLLITAERFFESLQLMDKHRIGVASLRFFHPKINKGAKVVSIYGRRNFKPTPTVEKPLIINEEKGGYTEEVKSMLAHLL